MDPSGIQKKLDSKTLCRLTHRRTLPGHNGQLGGPVAFGVLRAHANPSVFPLLPNKPAAVGLKDLLSRPYGTRGENAPGGPIHPKPALWTVDKPTFWERSAGKLIAKHSSERHQCLAGLSYWPFSVGNNTRTIWMTADPSS